jgi:hypothetical protein
VYVSTRDVRSKVGAPVVADKPPREHALILELQTLRSGHRPLAKRNLRADEWSRCSQLFEDLAGIATVKTPAK